MKRPLLIAALLAVAPIATGGAAQAQVTQMFNIKTPAAGTVDFRGEGTANFNQSLGTNNSFNVGSSTNLGVNASASSTSDYSSTGSASLKLDGSSRLQQTIGTASSAFNASTAAESSARSADITASSRADTQMYGNTLNETYAESWNSDSSYAWYSQDELDLAATATASSDVGYIEGISGTADAAVAVEGFYASDSAGGWEYNDAYNESATQSFDEAYTQAYNDEYSTAYETAAASATAATSNTDATGIIKGDFTTTTSGSADSTIGGLTSSLQQSASASAELELGADRESFSDLSTTEKEGYGLDSSLDNSGAFTIDMAASAYTGSETEFEAYESNYEAAEAAFQAEFDSSYQEAYAEDYSAANAALSRTSTSVVEVTGIGVIADVNADAASTFKASSNLAE
jgi:hypothetical protein